jgi:hypothetical protein
MVVVDAELKIHEFAFELQGWLEGRGGDHGDGKKWARAGNRWLKASGAIK